MKEGRLVGGEEGGKGNQCIWCGVSECPGDCEGVISDGLMGGSWIPLRLCMPGHRL